MPLSGCVVDSGDEADRRSVFDGHEEVVALVVQKSVGPGRVGGSIEEVGAGQNHLFVAAAEPCDLHPAVYAASRHARISRRATSLISGRRRSAIRASRAAAPGPSAASSCSAVAGKLIQPRSSSSVVSAWNWTP